MWNTILHGVSAFVGKAARRRHQVRGQRIELLESRQMLSAVSVSQDSAQVSRSAVPRAEQTHIFWGDFFGVEVTEGNSGEKFVTMKIFSSPAAKQNISIEGHFDIAGTGPGFADANDFAIEPFTATIKKGSASTTVRARVFGDTLPEPDEIFAAVITKVSTGVIDNGGEEDVKITNDDQFTNPDLPTVSFQTPNSTTVTEGTPQEYTLQLSKVSDVDVTVHLQLTGIAASSIQGAATIPDDVQFANGTGNMDIVIPAGTLTKTFSISTIDDAASELTEAYSIAIASADNANPAGQVSEVGTILDNDAPPTVSIQAQQSHVEGNSGKTTVPVTVTLSQTTDHPVIVHYSIEATTDKSISSKLRAKKKKDFDAVTGTVTIAAGQTTATISVSLVGDTKVEPNKIFLVRLTQVEGASLSSVQKVCQFTILDDDGVS